MNSQQETYVKALKQDNTKQVNIVLHYKMYTFY